MPQQYVLVTDAARRWSVGHFTVMAPPGGNWYHAVQTRGASFLRHGETEVHSVVAHAEPVGVDRETTDQTFEDSVKRHVERGADKGRFRFGRSEYGSATLAGMRCVAYEAEVQDTGATADRRSLSFVVLGRTCRHPSRVGEGIDANISERGRPGGGMSRESREQAAAFFESIKPN